MFPPAFVKEQLDAFTKEGDLTLDPFSGRGTTALESLLSGREAIACDINPVAYCISAAKANAPRLNAILQRVGRLESGFKRSSQSRLEAERERLPQFFRRAFFAGTLRQLVYLRAALDWRHNSLDRFVCALILGHLHGEMNRSPNYLSNQMPHSVSSKPAYSLKYWCEHNLWPPHRDTFHLLRHRAKFRLAQGAPDGRGKVALCDARDSGRRFGKYAGRVAAAITSPPYLDVTNFEEDQWLRLWFLGGSPFPTYSSVSRDDRHTSEKLYWKFLSSAWAGIKTLLKPEATIVVRIGAKNRDPEHLAEKVSASISNVWPGASRICSPRLTLLRNSQTKVLLPDATGCRFELDMFFALRKRAA